MSKWILLTALFLMPVFAQGSRADNLKAFREDLAAAVENGSLTAEEKKKYEDAFKTLDEARDKRDSGERVNRRKVRKAMQDLGSVSRSKNLKEEDRAKLAKRLEEVKAAR
jgi:polyhydroxyalkanoate synthesis regulator phasin